MGFRKRAEKNVEIILVEDCSKDNSWALCEELSKENLFLDETIKKYKKEIDILQSQTESKLEEYIIFLKSLCALQDYISDTLKNHRAIPAFPVVLNYFKSCIVHPVDSSQINLSKEDCEKMLAPENIDFYCKVDKEYWDKNLRLILQKIDEFLKKIPQNQSLAKEIEGRFLCDIFYIPQIGTTFNIEEMHTFNSDSNILSNPQNYKVSCVLSAGVKSTVIPKVLAQVLVQQK